MHGSLIALEFEYQGLADLSLPDLNIIGSRSVRRDRWRTTEPKNKNYKKQVAHVIFSQVAQLGSSPNIASKWLAKRNLLCRRYLAHCFNSDCDRTQVGLWSFALGHEQKRVNMHLKVSF
jgi:hypothetical protein